VCVGREEPGPRSTARTGGTGLDGTPWQALTSGFATGANFPIDLEVSEAGELYYLSRGAGT
jgi:hypothetical protein